jgi:hypothetical protein
VSAAARVLPIAPVRSRLALAPLRGLYQVHDRRTKQERDVTTYDAMCATRPLKPPPMPSQPQRVSAGALALHRDKKLGVYEEPRKT